MTNPTLAHKIADRYICECCHEDVVEELAAKIARRTKGETADNPHQAMFDTLYKSLEPYEKKFAEMINGIWEKERKILIANIKKLKKAYIIGKDNEDIVDHIIYPVAGFEKEIAWATEKAFIEIMIMQAAVEIDRLDLGISFDVENPEVKKWLEKYTFMFSEKLEEVNVEKLRRELIEGLEKGEGIPGLTKRVNETYDNWYKYRSESIARTEVIRASNRAALEVYKQSGVVKKKIWLANADACPWCLTMNNEVMALERNYWDQGDVFTIQFEDENGVMQTQAMKLEYENIESPPLHVRCRCSISAFFEE